MSQTSSFQQYDFSPKFRDEPSYRVSSIEVFNWGPFHGKHKCEIDEEGTAIIGPTGSGKTTLVDAMMTLLASNPRYNLASTGGDMSDRDLISYVRGVSGTESPHDATSHIARPGKTATGLCISYTSQYDQVCIGGILWIDSSSNAYDDLKRFWFIGQNAEDLMDQLLEMQNDEGKRQVKRFASETSGIRIYDNKRDYLAKVRGFFNVGDNAFTLLNRAAGLKQIYDIDQIFRDLVLDDKSQFVRAAEVVSEFDALKGIFEELEVARKQRDSLIPIQKKQEERDNILTQLTHLRHLEGILAVWYASIAEKLWEKELETSQQKEKETLQRLSDERAEEKRLSSEATTLNNKYLQLGGYEIEVVERDIKHTGEKLGTTRKNAEQYQNFVRQFQLKEDITPENFADNQGELNDLSASLTSSFDEARRATLAVSGQLVNHRQEMNHLREELNDIRSRKNSNIPRDFQIFRERLADQLGQAPEDLPYLAELVEVKPEEHRWRGAIERAIGSERLRILVPVSLMSQALSWVNSRDNKLHVRLQQADPVSSPEQGFDDGFVRKLNFKEHPLQANARHLLARRDRHCVDSVGTLRQVNHAMTVEGTMSDKEGRFEKQDQRRLDADWMIGFSNEHLLKTLTDRYTDLEQIIAQLDQDEKAHTRMENAIDQQRRIIEQLQRIEFTAIDTRPLEVELQQLHAKRNALIDPNSDMAKTKIELDAISEKMTRCRSRLDSTIESLGSIKKSKEQAEEQHENAKQQKGAGLNDEDTALAEKEFPVSSTAQVHQLPSMQDEEAKKLSSKIKEQLEKNSDTERQLASLMTKAKQTDTGALAEVGEGLQDVPDYLARLKTLLEEALPEKLDRFRQYLNKSSGQSVTQLLQHVEDEVTDIEERVAELNVTLSRVDYRNGNYLQLVTEKTKHESIRQVESAMSKLRRISMNAQDDEGDAQYKALGEVIRLIQEAVESKRNLSSQALLDPRHRLQFFVSEVNRDTGIASGKRSGSQTGSGGEKEMMTSFILTASLSYALSPAGASKPRYATIVLDEAFSKSSPAAATRIIEALRIFGLHPLFVTPNKEISLLKSHTRSAIIVHNKNQRATLTSLSWQEIENHARKSTSES